MLANIWTPSQSTECANETCLFILFFIEAYIIPLSKLFSELTSQCTLLHSWWSKVRPWRYGHSTKHSIWNRFLPQFIYPFWTRNSGLETLRQYLKQAREELSNRLLDIVYADPAKPNKWWMSFSKRKFLSLLSSFFLLSIHLKGSWINPSKTPPLSSSLYRYLVYLSVISASISLHV